MLVVIIKVIRKTIALFLDRKKICIWKGLVILKMELANQQKNGSKTVSNLNRHIKQKRNLFTKYKFEQTDTHSGSFKNKKCVFFRFGPGFHVDCTEAEVFQRKTRQWRPEKSLPRPEAKGVRDDRRCSNRSENIGCRPGLKQVLIVNKMLIK